MKTIKKIVLITALASLLGLMGFRLMSNKQIIDAHASEVEVIDFAIPVKVNTVERVEHREELAFTGEFEAQDNIRLIAESARS